MKIEELEKYLYTKKSTDNERKSFLKYIYNGIGNDFNILNGLFKKAYKKEKMNDLLNEENKTISVKNTINVLNSFDKIRMVDIYYAIFNCTEDIEKAHENYLNLLKIKCKDEEGFIKYIIIGEAPPFTFQKDSKVKFINNYILSKPRAGSWQTSIRQSFNISDDKPRAKEPEEFIKGLVKNNILFFDIIPVSLPFSTDIRKGWIKQKINEKPLLVNLLELAIKQNTKLLNIHNDVKVAFITPPKTSISIFDYYSDKKLEIKDGISIDIAINNDKTTKKKYKVSEDVILPMYKANAMMGSNTPSVDLIKLALDL